MPHGFWAWLAVDNFRSGPRGVSSVIVMARTIQVDIAALRRLAADLAGLAHQLDADNNGIGDSVSDPYITMALKDVQHDWSKKRETITTYLASAGQALAQAADAYDKVDKVVAQTATAGRAR